jgi:hypothetical protein
MIYIPNVSLKSCPKRFDLYLWRERFDLYLWREYVITSNGRWLLAEMWESYGGV